MCRFVSQHRRRAPECRNDVVISRSMGSALRGPTAVPERRASDRLPISIPFFVRGRKASGEEFLEFATGLDLSAGGVLLAMRRYLDPGTRISLEVPVALVNKAQLPHSVSLLRAVVKRCTPDRQHFLLGLQFEEPLISPRRHAGGTADHYGAFE